MDKANPLSDNQKQQSEHSIVFGSQSTMRWLNISTRTVHIAVMAILFGGCILDVPYGRLGLWHWLTIFSGLLLMFFEWMHDDRWWHRGKGLCIFVHVGLCLLIHVLTPMIKPLLWLILISGCVGSHMTRRYRHWSILEGPEKREWK
nr:hypothetical protein [uncultured Desulfobulbus sp.]